MCAQCALPGASKEDDQDNTNTNNTTTNNNDNNNNSYWGLSSPTYPVSILPLLRVALQ